MHLTYAFNRLDQKHKELLQQKEELLKESKAKATTMDNVKVQIDTLMKVCCDNITTWWRSDISIIRPPWMRREKYLISYNQPSVYLPPHPLDRQEAMSTVTIDSRRTYIGSRRRGTTTPHREFTSNVDGAPRSRRVYDRRRSVVAGRASGIGRVQEEEWGPCMIRVYFRSSGHGL